MKRKIAALGIASLAGLGLLAFQGAGGGQTFAAQVFNAQTGTGPSAPVRNIGATSHWLSYCTTNSAAVEVALEASNDGVNWFQISNMGDVTGCAVVTASGYYQNVRADIYENESSGGTATLTAYYTASTYPISNTGVLDVGIQPRPVMQTPATPVLLTGVLSAFTQASTTGAVVTDWYIYNPNASVVYALLKDNTLAEPVLRVVPATSGLDVSVSSGLSFPDVVNVSCSATYPSLTDPTTGCTMSLALRPTTFVNTLVNSSGAVQQRQRTGPH